jgi:ADP-heptose:LPS heptosyltransferase
LVAALLSADMMRFVDRWVGVPLCFLATLFSKLSRLFRPRGEPGPPRRILFIELAEIGGLVVAYPALSRARRLFPEAELYFLSFSGGQGLLELMGIVRQENHLIIRAENPVTFLLDTVRTIRRLRREKIDATVNLETFARYSTLLAFLSGARRRVGFYRFHGEGCYVGDLLTHKVIYNPHIHAAQSYIALVEALAEPGGPEPLCKQPVGHVPLDVPRVESSEADRKAMEQTLKALYPGLGPEHRLVLLNANASDLVAVRRWPMENFIQVARGLLEDERTVIVLTGTRDEWTHAEKMRGLLGTERVLNMAGRTTLGQLIDLYNVSHLLITNDSGPPHFASLTELPVLVLFGPETPRVYGPLGRNVQVIYLGLACSPCVSAYNQKRSPCHDNRCMKEIRPEEVLARARAMLEEFCTPGPKDLR